MSDHNPPPDHNFSHPGRFPRSEVSSSISLPFALFQGLLPFGVLALISAAIIRNNNAHQPQLLASVQKQSVTSPSTLPTPDNSNPYIAELLQKPGAEPEKAPSPTNQTAATGAPAPSIDMAPVTLAAPTPPPNSPGKAAFAQGEAALRQQKWDEAKNAFEKALQLDANLAPAHLRLASLAANNNDAVAAQSHLEAAARLLPNDASPRLQLSQLFLQVQQPQKAELAAQEAVQLAKGPLRRAAQGNYARILTANKKEARAYEVWTSLLKTDSKDSEAALAASLLAGEKLGKPQESQKLLAQAIKAPPSNPQISLVLAQVLAGKKQFKDASKVLTAGAQKFPVFIPLHLALAELKLARGEGESAAGTLRTLLARVPANAAGGNAKAEVQVALSQVLARSGQTKQAIAEAKNALKMQPRNPAVVASVAEVFLGSGDSQSGIAALKSLIQLDPKNKKAHHILAGAYADTKQWDAAQKELDFYIKAEPGDLSALVDKAGLFERRGKKDEALKTWDVLAKKKPDAPLAPLQQARLLAQMQKFQPALERYKTVLKLVPNQPDALLGAAEIEEKRGDSDAALGHLKQFVSVAPKFEPAYEAMARVAKKENQMAPTVDFLKTQLVKNPDRRGAYALILDFYETQGKAETGRTFVKSYIDKNPKLIAPRAAIEEFDLRRAKAKLADLLKADQNKTDKASLRPADKNETGKPLLRERGSTLPAPSP